MRISKRWQIALVSIFILISVPCVASYRYISLYLTRKPAARRPVADLLLDPVASRNPDNLLAEANRLAFLFNWPKAEPFYVRAEEAFRQKDDIRNETYARIGRISAGARSRPLEEVSEELERELDFPIVKHDMRLRLWCLVSAGYIDLNLSPARAGRDWAEAQKLAHVLGEPQWEARATGELGIISFLNGDPSHAATLAGDALLSAIATGDAGAQIRYLQIIGNGFNELTRYGEALALFDRAIGLAKATADAGFPYMAFEGKSQALIGRGSLSEAKDVLEQALMVTRQDEMRVHECQILIDLGELAIQMGDREQGKRHLQEAAAVASKYKFSRGLAQAMRDLVKFYRDEGDLKSAEDSASAAVKASRQLGERYFLPRDLTMLAELKSRRGDVTGASTLYENAEDVIDGMLINLHEPYWTSSLVGAMSQTYLEHFQLEAGRGHVKRALYVIERVRGRTASTLLENKVSFGSSQEIKTLQASVSELQLRLMRSKSATQRADGLDQLAESERRLEWAQKDVAGGQQRWFERPASLRSIQRMLRPDEVVLEYVLSQPHAYCIWVSKHGAGLQALPEGPKQIEAATRRYLDQIRAKRDDADVAKRLYNVLLDPLLRRSNAQRVIVIPDGILHFLPFEALRDPTGSLFVESRTVSYAPAATVLKLLREVPRTSVSRRSFLGVGDAPYQGQRSVSGKVTKPNAVGLRLLRGLSDTFGMRFYDLPQTRREVLEISKIFGNDSVLLLGPNATETAFKSQPLSEFEVVHLAVHGFVDTEFPDRSGLVLGVDPNSQDDGLLQVREITHLHFDADLVTLSACDTGVGKLQGQEGVTSLAEAFLISGSRAVVASVWSADDTYTQALMDRFYMHIGEGKDKASALREAKVDLIAEYGAGLSPYFWAAFVLIGDGASAIQRTGR